ncbi:hypothetical protein KBY70_10655 [Cyanobium sp. ATX 6E8]|nr:MULTISPECIES: hypothetical protein [unclassified Cyanobium]MCP9891222.1 hypothetical protein [Cyanobium sp. Aljojuca 7D2]MCP9942848.1 hypothetical protein [Cyanobium sp. ATX 6E8]
MASAQARRAAVLEVADQIQMQSGSLLDQQAAAQREIRQLTDLMEVPHG